MLSNLLTFDAPKVIFIRKPVLPFVSQIKFDLEVDGPKHSAMDMRSNAKVMTVKRSYNKPCSRLARSIAKEKVKAKASARERALTRAGFDLHHMDPNLGPNIFDETDSEL